jgi:hypothetical protein
VSTGVQPSNKILGLIIQTNTAFELTLRGMLEPFLLGSQMFVLFVELSLLLCRYLCIAVVFHPFQLRLLCNDEILIVSLALISRMTVRWSTCHGRPRTSVEAR